MQELNDFIAEEEAAAEPKQQEVADSEVEQCRITAASVLEKIKPFAENVGKAFTDNKEENLQIINDIIEKLRADKEILKLNQIVKLKLQYEQFLEQEQEQIEEKEIR